MKNVIAAILSIAAIAAVSYWGMIVLVETQGVELSIHGKIAMGLGVVFTMGIGFGLMALLFYSNKRGHDEVVYHLTEDANDGTPDN